MIQVTTVDDGNGGVWVSAMGHADVPNDPKLSDKVCAGVSALLYTLYAVGSLADSVWSGDHQGMGRCHVAYTELDHAKFALSGLALIRHFHGYVEIVQRDNVLPRYDTEAWIRRTNP